MVCSGKSLHIQICKPLETDMSLTSVSRLLAASDSLNMSDRQGRFSYIPLFPIPMEFNQYFPQAGQVGKGFSQSLYNNCVRCKYHNSSRCFYTLKFEGVNKLLSVFCSFSLGNFSTLSSNQVSPTSRMSPLVSKNADLVLQKLSCCCTLRTSFFKDFAVRKCCMCCFPSWQQLYKGS